MDKVSVMENQRTDKGSGKRLRKNGKEQEKNEEVLPTKLHMYRVEERKINFTVGQGLSYDCARLIIQ